MMFGQLEKVSAYGYPVQIAKNDSNGRENGLFVQVAAIYFTL